MTDSQSPLVRYSLSMTIASILASCASAGTHDLFAGYHAGTRLRRASEVVLVDCGRGSLQCQELMPKTRVDESIGHVNPYDGGASFEVVHTERWFDADVWAYGVEVKEVASGKLYWASLGDMKGLFEKESHE